MSVICYLVTPVDDILKFNVLQQSMMSMPSVKN